MQTTTELEEMLAGYRIYADSTEIAPVATADAPASSPLCGFLASFAFSYLTTGGPGRK